MVCLDHGVTGPRARSRAEVVRKHETETVILTPSRRTAKTARVTTASHSLVMMIIVRVRIRFHCSM